MTLDLDLHDVEFVATSAQPGIAGHHLSALPALKHERRSRPDVFHLSQPYTDLGPGDRAILDGLSTLRELQQQGKIRRIGISGYPLPVLLRIALLAKWLIPMKPLDIIQTYAQQTILNNSLERGFLEAFTETASVGQVMNAAPLAMGVLTDSGGPSWHPVRTQLGGQWEASREAASLCRERGTSLEVVASEYGFKELRQKDGKLVPVVVGCKNVHEVRRALESYRDAKGGVSGVGAEVVKLFEDKGVRGLSWANP